MSDYYIAGAVVTDAVPRAGLWISEGTIHRREPSCAWWNRLDGWILPGLADLHCHVGLGPNGPVGRPAALRQALADRNTGVTLIRDAGSPADTRWLDDISDVPTIIRAGTHLARHRRYLRGYGLDVEPPELAAEVVRQAERSDGWVKIVADWIQREDGADADLAPLWPREVLIDAVAVAHDVGARVTAHAFSHVVIDDLLAAGVDCIEHGTGVDADQAAELAARGVPVVPTMLQVGQFAQIAEHAGRYPAYAEHMRGLHARRYEQLRLLADAGVELLPGTDAGGTLAHGLLPDELLEWQRAGLAPVDILTSATVRARAFLGAPALRDGAPADLVVYSDDPREDLEVLRRPRAVFLEGRLVAGSVLVPELAE